MVKTVGIIGAGPSGLIAAKTLLRDYPPGTFKVTVFEKSSQIGGLWSRSWMNEGRMRTNISRWTVAFSCFGWQELPNAAAIAQFPTAKDVSAYLDAFVDKFELKEHIHTDSEVIAAKRRDGEAGSATQGWAVDVRTKRNEAETITHHFDDLIVAAGFFATPKIPDVFCKNQGFSTDPNTLGEFSGKDGTKIVHSTQFRGLKSILAPNSTGRNIVVVGGSMSGVEVASTIAMEISSEVNSPGSSVFKKKKYGGMDEYKVIHVVKRPFWVMPYFLPVKPVLDNKGVKTPNPAPSFLPLDLVMYDLNRRPPPSAGAGVAVHNYSGAMTVEGAMLTHSKFELIVGSDQSQYFPKQPVEEENQSLTSNYSQLNPLAIQGAVRSEAPWLAISDHYTEFVRDRLIVPYLGRVRDVTVDTSKEGDWCQIQIEHGNLGAKVENIAAIVLATGFEADTSLSFLPPEVLEALSYDNSSSAFPILLDLHMTSCRKYRDLGFVGHYRGPYWGVIEQQSRIVADIFLGANYKDNGAEEMSKLREVAINSPSQLAQFPMGDYIYLMESLRTILSSQRHPLFPDLNDPERSLFNPVLPASYPPRNAEPDVETLVSLHETLKDVDTSGKFMARAIFRALHGKWSLRRSLRSRIVTYPSGLFTGTATFKPRKPTDDAFDGEYLYFEAGEFVTDSGMKFTASRPYVYRHSSSTDALSAWFVKTTDNKSVDYLFHELLVESRPETALVPEITSTQQGSAATSTSGWKASSSHLCIADLYDVEYQFWFKGVNIERWTMEYEVKGPQKDYRIENVFTRE